MELLVEDTILLAVEGEMGGYTFQMTLSSRSLGKKSGFHSHISFSIDAQNDSVLLRLDLTDRLSRLLVSLFLIIILIGFIDKIAEIAKKDDDFSLQMILNDSVFS